MNKGNKLDYGTQKAKEQKMAPLEEEIKFWRNRMIMLYQIKNFKIPFYEKLPKDNQFYRHLITLLGYNKMKESTQNKVEESNMIFNEAIRKIEANTKTASRSASPVNRKLMIY
jgi:hypothetical protein